MKAFFWPTELVFVDDDLRVLDFLKIHMEKYYKNLIFFTNPLEALDYIKNKPDNLIDFIQPKETLEYGEVSLNINLNKIHKLRNNVDRFKMTSTIIVDYMMPQLNGLEFLKELAFSKCSKILLTSFLDDASAIENLNSKNIDCFLRKEPSDAFIQKLLRLIQYSENLFFEKLGNIFWSSNKENFVYSDIHLQQYFDDTLRKLEIREYYLIDSNYNYLLIDKDNQEFLYLVYTVEQLEEMLYDGTGECSDETLKLIKDRKRAVGVFRNNKIVYPPYTSWSKHLIPLISITTEKNVMLYIGIMKL